MSNTATIRVRLKSSITLALETLEVVQSADRCRFPDCVAYVNRYGTVLLHKQVWIMVSLASTNPVVVSTPAPTGTHFRDPSCKPATHNLHFSVMG